MATVSANQLSLEKTLEELITEFNSLRGDVSAVTLETLISAASSSIVFEGSTDDANETTLTVVDPTGDRTVTLPNATGTVVTTGNADAGATTTTFADLDQFLIADGAVLKKMALSTIAANLPTITPASANANALGSASLEWSDLFLGDGSVINFGNDQDTKLTHTDGSGLTLNSTNKLMFNDASQFIQGASATVLDIAATDEIELTATLIDVVGNLTASGIIKTDDTTEATSTTDGSLQTDGGLSVAKDIVAGDDIKLLSDASVIAFGTNGDVTLTHVHDTGILLNSTMQLQFNDASQNINAPSATVLDINATDEIELNATLADVNANLDVSGTIVGASTVSAGTAFVPASADGATLGTNSLEFSDLFLADGALINWGNDQDVSIKHVADTGLTITNTNGAADNNPIVLQLKSEEDAIIADEVIASLEFAAGDSDGTDGATVAAGIHAIAEGTFSASANATKLVFTTGVSETAASSATAKMTLSSAGLLTIADDFIIKDGGTIGSASDTDAIAIGSDGDVTLTQDLELQHDGAILSFGANDEVTLTHVHDTGLLLNGTMQLQFNDASQNINAPSATVLDINATDEIELNATLVDINANVEISGNLSVAGTTTTVNTVTMEAQNAVIFEGATADAHETTLTITDPTADRTITLPDQTGTVHTSGGDTTHTNIIIADGGNIGSASDTNAIGISSGGVVSITATTANSLANNGALTVAGGVGIAGDLTVGDDLRLLSDNSVLSFGTNSDITVTHTEDVGLIITNVIADTDNRPIRLQLKSEEDAIVADDVIATIEMAAGDSDGTDAAVVAAGIHAIAEGTFSASANATKLVFTTGVSETAAATATAKMTLSSAGLLTIADDLIIKNSGTIGTAADSDLLTMGSGNLTVAGTVTATAGATLLIKNASGSTLKTIKGMT